jgi:alpha-methylacyl-CoA racemase
MTEPDSEPHGALAGLRVVELPAIGPVPFAATMLADHGAEVVRITGPRPDFSAVDPAHATHLRGRPALPLNLREPAEREQLLAIVARADVLLDGFRPGVLERLDLAPEVLMAHNRKLVIGRMTGWGQDGPLARRAGHDITYIAVAGALRHVARAGERPVPPLNLVGDFGGGAMYLLFGVLAALWEAQRSGRGQVVDAAMVDGASSLMGLIYSLAGQGQWQGGPGENLLDTGAPFYDVYRCSDGGYLAVGCLEPQFYALFLAGLGLAAEDLPAQYDRAGWPRLREVFTDALGDRPRAHWEAVFADSDACVAPVLTMAEAQQHPHLVARRSFTTEAGVPAPAAAPRLSRTPGRAGPIRTGAAADRLRAWGVAEAGA